MLCNKPHFRWILATAEGKDITCIRLAGVHTIVVNSPELGREFLRKHDASFASRPLTMATEYLGRHFLSVVFSPWGNQWRKMRRFMASEVVSLSRINQEVKLRHEEADFFVHFIYNLCKKERACSAINLRTMTRFYAGNVIRRMLFRKRFLQEGAMRVDGMEGIKDEVEYVEASFTVLCLVYAICPSDYIPWLRVFDLEGHERIIRRAIELINRHHDPIIEERMDMWRDGRKKVVEDILDVLISVKDGNGDPLMTMEEVKAQTAEFVIGNCG